MGVAVAVGGVVVRVEAVGCVAVMGVAARGVAGRSSAAYQSHWLTSPKQWCSFVGESGDERDEDDESAQRVKQLKLGFNPQTNTE